MQKVSLVALVQMKSSESKDENLRLSLNFIKEAAKKEGELDLFSRVSNGILTELSGLQNSLRN